MPVYTYRREDGTTFDMRQKFLDDPLETCPTTGQAVVRVIQPAGVIFKGSGFYVNDSKGANPAGVAKPSSAANGGEADSKTETKTETKSDTTSVKSEPKADLPKAAGE